MRGLCVFISRRATQPFFCSPLLLFSRNWKTSPRDICVFFCWFADVRAVKRMPGAKGGGMTFTFEISLLCIQKYTSGLLLFFWKCSSWWSTNLWILIFIGDTVFKWLIEIFFFLLEEPCDRKRNFSSIGYTSKLKEDIHINIFLVIKNKENYDLLNFYTIVYSSIFRYKCANVYSRTRVSWSLERKWVW